MKKTVLALSLFAMLSCGPRVLLDETIPHRIAKPATVHVYGRLPDGSMGITPRYVDDRYWIAGPGVIGSHTGE